MQTQCKVFKIATRNSPLALWQANAVVNTLQRHYPNNKFVLVPLTTAGDRLPHESLTTFGGKGLFIKELEHALEQGQADFAVHSAKDVPLRTSADWSFCTILSRAQVADALVLPQSDVHKKMSATEAIAYLHHLPTGSVIGTASIRRRSILNALFPHLNTQIIRGNLGTRLRKLDEAKQYQTLILAAAGLERLDYATRINAHLPLTDFLPAIAQAALMVQFASRRNDIAKLLQPLVDPAVAQAVEVERALGRQLVASKSGCQMPLAVYAYIVNGEIHMQAQIFSCQGKKLYAQAKGNSDILNTVKKSLCEQGAERVLQEWESLEL